MSTFMWWSLAIMLVYLMGSMGAGILMARFLCKLDGRTPEQRIRFVRTRSEEI